MLGYHLESHLETKIGRSTSYKESSTQGNSHSQTSVRGHIRGQSIREYQGYQ